MLCFIHYHIRIFLKGKMLLNFGKAKTNVSCSGLGFLMMEVTGLFFKRIKINIESSRIVLGQI